MPTTLYFSNFQTNSIAMLYLVHKYKKKFESTNMDLTHSNIMIFFQLFYLGGMVVEQVIQLCRSLYVANLGLFSVTHSLAYKNKEPFKTVYAI